MYLHNDPQTFDAAVARTANALKLNPAILAKDYFVYLVLREITQRFPDIVFKGGTSLSKCHKAIERFSEDVDLGVEAEHLTRSEHKRVKQAVVESIDELGLTIQNPESIRSGRDYNKYEINLPVDVGVAGLSRNLIVETAFMTPVSPSVDLPVGCFIYDFYSGVDDGAALLNAYDLSPFTAHVTTLERAFADKMFALCDYYLEKRPAERCSRHIYDEYKLLNSVKLDGEMANLFAKVREQRQNAAHCPSASPDVDVAAVLNEIIDSRYYESDYRAITRQLLWENVPYEDAIISLAKVASFLEDVGWRS